jgi:hypothetical protein
MRSTAFGIYCSEVSDRRCGLQFTTVEPNEPITTLGEHRYISSAHNSRTFFSIEKSARVRS